MTSPPAGYRLQPHTADVIVEAWAPTRAGCLQQAVRGLVAAFADVAGLPSSHQVSVTLPAQRDDELLLELLDEVIYQLDAADGVVVDAAVTDNGDTRAQIRLMLAPVDAVRQRGAVPKGISHHDLGLAQLSGTWWCWFTVDV